MKPSKILVLVMALLAIAFIASCSNKQTSNPITSTVTPSDNTINPFDSVEGRKDRMQPAAAAAYNAYPGGWKFPFCGSYYISSGYGPKAGSPYHEGKEFYAIDWNLPGWNDFGQVIPAPAGGIVTESYFSSSYGHTVLVEAGNGYTYRIAHMNYRYVRSGQTIRLGDPIGTVGTTGYSTGPHIHFVVYRYGNSVPQNGISGKDPLLVGHYYSSNQTCMSIP